MRKAKGSEKLRKQVKAKTKTRQRPTQKNAPIAAKAKSRDYEMHGAFAQPLQSPPAGREYLRALIGKQANPALNNPIESSATINNADQRADNYFIQLSTFHVRNRGF
jgi:hypothetical protein